jgi:biopolymer transport protein ExbB
MSNKTNSSNGNGIMAYFAGLAIVTAIVVGIVIYTFLMGNPANFEGGDPVKGHPLNLLGIILSSVELH